MISVGRECEPSSSLASTPLHSLYFSHSAISTATEKRENTVQKKQPVQSHLSPLIKPRSKKQPTKNSMRLPPEAHRSKSSHLLQRNTKRSTKFPSASKDETDRTGTSAVLKLQQTRFAASQQPSLPKGPSKRFRFRPPALPSGINNSSPPLDCCSPLLKML